MEPFKLNNKIYIIETLQNLLIADLVHYQLVILNMLVLILQILGEIRRVINLAMNIKGIHEH